MNRRCKIKTGTLLAVLMTNSAFALAPNDLSSADEKVKPTIEKNVAWFDVKDWGVEGRGWEETKNYFDRLPARAEKTVRGAGWGLSRHSAGMAVRFATNSETIRVRYRLSSPNLAMVHMPATGVSGVDLYGEDLNGKLRWVNVARPSSQDVDAVLANRIDALPGGKVRQYVLYLPLYNGVEKLHIGVSTNADFKPQLPRAKAPILFYGTSIMHGACASRPGMSISAIVGRALNQPTINLGFSGNGKMEKEVGDLICELSPAAIAIDCLPNMNANLVKERTEALVYQLRKTFPETPLLLVEDRSFTNSVFFKQRRDHHTSSRKELLSAYNRLIAADVKNVHYLSGENLLGKDGEAATDGSHPNDLGMMRYADQYIEALGKILPSR